MTDHSDLVARLGEIAQWAEIRAHRGTARSAAALIETQAAELVRLRGALGDMVALIDRNILGLDPRAFNVPEGTKQYVRILLQARTAIKAGSHLEEGE